MYCLNAFKSLLFKEKLKQKYWYLTMQDCQCNKDNTNHYQHILHWTTVRSPKYWENALQTTCLTFQ